MLISIALSALLLTGRQGPDLIHNTFERDVEGWKAVQLMGAGAMVSLSRKPEDLRVGAGSLEYDYQVASGQSSAAMLTMSPGSLAKMASVEMWVKNDHATNIVVVVQEHEGGRYSAIANVSKGKWQKVELSISDFVISTEPDAPKDPDGKLDADQIDTFGVVDFDQFLVQNKTIADAVGTQTGPRKLWLSDIRFSQKTIPDTFVKSAGGFEFDNYSRPQPDWLGFGVEGMSIATDTPFAGNWLKLDYHVSQTHVSGAVKPLQPKALAGKSSLVLNAGAVKDCQVLVQLEEVNGAKFNTVVSVPGMARSKELSIAFSDLKISDDSPDKNAKLDLSQVKQVVVLDISGVAAGADQDNTLWIGRVVAK